MPYETRSLVKVRPLASSPSFARGWVAAEALWNAEQETSVISARLASRLGLALCGEAERTDPVDAYSVDILLMDRVFFPAWQVHASDAGSDAPDLVLGMDMISRADEEARRQLQVCFHCPNCRGVCIMGR